MYPVVKSGLYWAPHSCVFLPRLLTITPAIAQTQSTHCVLWSSYQGTAQPQAILGQYLCAHRCSDASPQENPCGCGHLFAWTRVFQCGWLLNIQRSILNNIVLNAHLCISFQNTLSLFLFFHRCQSTLWTRPFSSEFSQACSHERSKV